MIRHVAMLTFAEATTQSDIDEIDRGLGTLPALIPEIRYYAFGRDLRLSEGTADYVVVADFESEEDLRTYASHPSHLSVIETAIKPFAVGTSRVQYTIG